MNLSSQLRQIAGDFAQERTVRTPPVSDLSDWEPRDAAGGGDYFFSNQ